MAHNTNPSAATKVAGTNTASQVVTHNQPIIKTADLVVNKVASNGTVTPLTSAGATINAGSFVTGQGYKILTAGNTTFTSIGAANNNVGTTFVATGAGSGTGTAVVTDYTVTSLGSGRSLSGATVTVLAAVATNATIQISTKNAQDTSNDSVARWTDEGCPIDGELSVDAVSQSSVQTGQKRSYTMKERSTLLNP